MAETAVVTLECDYCKLIIKTEPKEANIGWTEFIVELPEGWHEIVIDPAEFGLHPCYNVILVCEKCYETLSKQGKVIEDFWKRSKD
jgi:hypothetical protein